MKLKEAADMSHKLLTDPVEIDGWLDLQGIATQYELTSDNKVNRSAVDLNNARIGKIRVQFGKVDYMYLENNDLTSLKGVPEVCDRMIIKNNKKLTSLKYSGKIKEDFDCSNCALTTLEGGPQPVENRMRYYNCGNNPLTTFSGAPENVQYFWADETNITGFEGAPKVMQKFAIRKCSKLTSLKDIHKHITHCELIDISHTPLKSHLLGLIMINDLKTVLYSTDDPFLDSALDIVTRYLGKGRKGVIHAQEELIEMDLEEFSKL